MVVRVASLCQQALNVDLSQIEGRVAELVKREGSLHAIHGELISE